MALRGASLGEVSRLVLLSQEVAEDTHQAGTVLCTTQVHEFPGCPGGVDE
jgi:hypothetical protein